MGRRGPKTQPVAILKKKGTLNVTRLKDAIASSEKLEFVFECLVDPPEILQATGVDLWRTQLAQAQKLYGYISFIDLKLFGEYCHTYEMLHSIRGRLYSPPKSEEYSNKEDWSNYHKLCTRFDKLSSEFGFSPSGRTRIQLEQKPEENKEDDYSIE